MKEMTLKEVQQVSLDILQEFHDFCTRNDIKYSLSGGTLLGAIRHNGFIPWDDDIDVQMPRPDYDKFIHTYVSESNGFELLCSELVKSKDLINGWPYARLCEKGKTMVDMGTKPWVLKDVGVWIDIFPCDGIPSNKSEAQKHLILNKIFRAQSYWFVMKYVPWSVIKKTQNLKERIKFIAKKIISYAINTKSCFRAHRFKKKFDYCQCNYFFATPQYGIREWQPKKNMESFVLHQFEDREFYIMSGYDENLKSLYGDYMQLPPEDKRMIHFFNKYYWKE